jgi:cytochrome c peroxidase
MPAPKASEVTRPAGSKPFAGDRSALVTLGKTLYLDTKLSTNDMSCASCHTDGAMFMDSFKQPYPHSVQMAKEVSNMDTITAEGMVQYCLIRPMMSKPLGWDSQELAALTAYVEEVQKEHIKK